MTWAVAEAKAKFSEVLDRAETAGPQVVTRRKREFVVMTREESDRRTAAQAGNTPKPFVSAWDALGGPELAQLDFEIPRLPMKIRPVDFE